MDYKLFLHTNLIGEMLADLLYRLMCEVFDKVRIEKHQSPHGYLYIYIGSEYFSIVIDLDDQEKADFLELSKEAFNVTQTSL
ncbi:hypothetical protein J25TS5_37020 [Paenibacillus faecis]|nr:hypothetical protein J25TS5_37020 [Paenibacillus faecis]